MTAFVVIGRDGVLTLFDSEAAAREYARRTDAVDITSSIRTTKEADDVG